MRVGGNKATEKEKKQLDVTLILMINVTGSNANRKEKSGIWVFI